MVWLELTMCGSAYDSQPALSSGDGFTFLYDTMMRKMQNKKLFVDEVMGWAGTLKGLFMDTAEFLTEAAKYRVVQNFKKFK